MSETSHPLLGFARQLSIAHHIPGRIRLKMGGPVTDDFLAVAGQAKRFGKACAAIAGISSISINALARSCTVEYDAGAIPPASWSGFLSGETAPESEVLRRLLLSAARA